MKAAVVGAGFAGLIMSRELAKRGIEVDLYEEHDRVGYPKHCTGLVSKETARIIGAPARQAMMASFEKLYLRSLENDVVEVIVDGVVKLDRVRLEQLLLEEAVSSGVRPFLGVRVVRINPDTDRPSVIINGMRRRYDIVILAEGLHGALRRQLGIHYEPATTLGVNLEAETHAQGLDGIEIVTSKSYKTLVFAWRVPLRGKLLAGAIAWRPADALGAAKTLLGGRSKGLEIYGGRVIHGPPLPPSMQPNRVLIVGDAAGLTKPLTGGGLYPSSLLTWRAGSLIDRGVPLEEALNRAYEEVYKVLWKQYKLARAAIRLGALDDIIGALAASTRRIGYRRPLDYDNHRDVPRRILREQPIRSLIFLLRLLVKSPGLTLRLIKGALF